MDQVICPAPETENKPAADAESDTATDSPWLTSARRFLSLALRYDYLSSGLRHKQTRRIIADRQHSSRSLKQEPPVSKSDRDLDGLNSQDSERAYLNHVAQVERLTSSEEYCLAKRVKAGDATARNSLIEANLGLVVMLARHYRRPDMQLIDLIAEGNFGLIAATHSFNPELGFRFSTYAKWAVRRAIERKLPKLMSVERALTCQTLKGANAADLKSEARPSTELCVEVDVDIDIDIDINELEVDTAKADKRSAISLLPISTPPLRTSLSDRLGSDETAMTARGFEADEETLATLAIPEEQEPPHAAHTMQRNNMLARALAQLSERERLVIMERYALASDDIVTLDQLARRLQISVERVRQIECAALKKLDLLLRSAGESPDSLL